MTYSNLSSYSFISTLIGIYFIVLLSLTSKNLRTSTTTVSVLVTVEISVDVDP